MNQENTFLYILHLELMFIPEPWVTVHIGDVLPQWRHLPPQCLPKLGVGWDPAGHVTGFSGSGQSLHCPRHVSRRALYRINWCWCANSSPHLK